MGQKKKTDQNIDKGQNYQNEVWVWRRPTRSTLDMRQNEETESWYGPGRNLSIHLAARPTFCPDSELDRTVCPLSATPFPLATTCLGQIVGLKN